MGMLYLLAGLVLVWLHDSGAQEDPLFPFSEYLDPGGNVSLRWGFDDVKGTIIFELTINTTGWVGLGFSPNGGMAGSDIVIGGVGPDGNYFMDRYAEGQSLPLIDEVQNYKLLKLTEANGQTLMKFERPIKSCDKQDFSITEVPVKLIYAYGQGDDIDYHRNQRGTKEVNLLKYMPRASPPDSHYFDLTMTNFTIPPNSTYYHCKVLRAPTFDQKHHIFRIEPVLEQVAQIHHILLYRCPPRVKEPSEGQCFSSQDKAYCLHTVTAWGIGGGAFEFPEVTGLPIGGEEGDILYRLEVHYNNPMNTEGLVDNSGLRFYYTAKLRQHDAAVLMTGLSVYSGYAIPPNASDFQAYGLCDTNLIQQMLPEPVADLQVFATIHHTHLAGRKVRVGHFRNGQQIDFLSMDEHYNFELQEVKNLGKTKTVKKGDQLLVECTYNTDKRGGLTWGGLATTDEMCLAFLYYYPATGLSFCLSYPDMKALQAKMGVSTAGEWYMIMHQKTWDKTSTTEYEHILKEIPQHTEMADVYNNYTVQMRMIPDLKVPTEMTCNDHSQIQTPVAMTFMLLCVGLQRLI